jgi:hypothetical protein
MAKGLLVLLLSIKEVLLQLLGGSTYFYNDLVRQLDLAVAADRADKEQCAPDWNNRDSYVILFYQFLHLLF